MADNKHYRVIIAYLGQRKFATREDIAKHLKIKNGGTLSAVLTDLVKCGFIEKYTPYNMNERSKLTRYRIHDNYLHFYYHFIEPKLSRIRTNDFSHTPNLALPSDSYQKWLGHAFERFCRKYHRVIASCLGFSGIHYQSGSFYNRTTDRNDPNFQIDLLFDRRDGVITVCEIKYTHSTIGSTIIDAFEKKIEHLTKKNNKTIQRVLNSKAGISDALIKQHYFDEVITLDQLFDPHYWR